MSGEPDPVDPCLVWKEQLREAAPVALEGVVSRRAWQSRASTRAEIVLSIVAALFLMAVLAWRLPRAGFVVHPGAALAVAAWMAITVVRLYRTTRISRPEPDAASSGLAYYRRELELRRDHLRRAWLWHGPLLLALLLSISSFAGGPFPGLQRLWDVAPLLIVLGVWIAVTTRRRLQEAAEIRREIEEIRRFEENE